MMSSFPMVAADRRNASISPARGRKKLVSDSVIDIVAKKNKDNNLAGALQSSKEIAKLIEIERHLELGPGAYLDALTPMSRSVRLRATCLGR